MGTLYNNAYVPTSYERLAAHRLVGARDRALLHARHVMTWMVRSSNLRRRLSGHGAT